MRGPYTRNNTPCASSQPLAPHCRHHALVASYSSLTFHSNYSESSNSPSRGWSVVFSLFFPSSFQPQTPLLVFRVWTTSFNVPVWLWPPMEVQATVALLLFLFSTFFVLTFYFFIGAAASIFEIHHELVAASFIPPLTLQCSAFFSLRRPTPTLVQKLLLWSGALRRTWSLSVPPCSVQVASRQLRIVINPLLLC